MVDAKIIKEQLTTEDIISLLADMGADYNFFSAKQIHFRSICHNSESFKLYYYIQSQSFYCHRCGKKFDIFSLIEQVRNIDFKAAVEYVCQICHIEATYTKKPTFIDQWQSMKKYLPNSNYVEPLKVYDKEVLSLFKPYLHQSWLDEGITEAAMQKFQIGWYERNEQITIPVFDQNGNLVGIHGRNTNRALIEKGYKYIPVKTLNEQYKFPTNAVLYGFYENQKNIEQTKEVCLFEAPKSVLMAETILPDNNAVALFGMNLNRHRANILLNLGVEKIVICLDKQYMLWYNDEWKLWKEKVMKIANLFSGMTEVYVVCDKADVLDYKDSPMDKGKDIWNVLYQNRIRIK